MGLALLKNRFLSIIIQNLLQHNTAYEVSIAKKITEQSVARMSQASLVDHVILDRQLKLAGDFLNTQEHGLRRLDMDVNDNGQVATIPIDICI